MADIKVGKPDTKPDAPAHTPGVHEGNESGGIENSHPGFYPTGERGPSQRQIHGQTLNGNQPRGQRPDRPEQPVTGLNELSTLSGQPGHE